MKKYKIMTEIIRYFEADKGTQCFEQKINEVAQEGYVIEHFEHRVDDCGNIVFSAVMSKEEK